MINLSLRKNRESMCKYDKRVKLTMEMTIKFSTRALDMFKALGSFYSPERSNCSKILK